MTPCPKHPDYDGGYSGIPINWNCRACRKICKAVKEYEKETRTQGATQETWVHHGQTSTLHKSVSENIKTLADLISVCEIDTNTWEVERWQASKTETIGGPRYHIKANLRRRTYLIDARSEIEELKRIAKSCIPTRPLLGSGVDTGGQYMLEVNIPDLHLGKLAWSPETGHAEYDSKIAEEVFEEALYMLIERTISYKFSEILLPLGNDILHSDTKFGTTTAGTQLDTDSRYQKNFSRVRDLSIRAIERLRGIAPVRVVMVPGNHDTLSVWHLGDSLECYYHDTEGVTIDNSPCSRKYHQFGQVMLMLTHGQNGKLSDYPLLMATEAPSIFGSTTHREAHTGHTHQLKVQELHGVRIRVISSLTPPDAWHAEKGFVGNLRSAEAFVWSKTEGLIGTAVFNLG